MNLGFEISELNKSLTITIQRELNININTFYIFLLIFFQNRYIIYKLENMFKTYKNLLFDKMKDFGSTNFFLHSIPKNR